ncbi:MAG TPA: TetR family transcriptional regulator C-terminal domain-containing protein [Gemmatimonadaceae bacterium]|nr:TetR family transcriptional regulator C-terminal domain-containing protein [Gemmatimonadaceae bacterium]
MRDRKTQIIDAATALIMRNGFQQTSVEDVIREAGLCGKGHFYHHFKSKEELGYAVLERRFEQFAEEGLAILREPLRDPLHRLNDFIDAIVAAHAEPFSGGCPFGNLAAEMADAHEGFRARLVMVFERWAEQIQALLWEVRPRLVEGADIARLSRFIIATLEGAILMSKVHRESGVLKEVADELKRCMALHIRSDVRASNGVNGFVGAAGAQASAGPGMGG